MALIHINRAGTSLGTFTEEDLRQGIRAGRFSGSDLGWREGMPAWQPLSQFTEFAADLSAGAAAPPTPPSAAPPLATPLATVAPAGTPPPGGTVRAGLPWDERQTRGWFNAFIETLQMVLSRPTQAYSAMKTEGGLGEPLIYAVIGGSFGLIVYYVYHVAFRSAGFFGGTTDPLTHSFGMAVGGVFLIIFAPVFVIIGVFISAAIIHLSLMIVGGARKPFETTFRVIAFSHGSTSPLQLVPFCGSVIAAVWGLILNCIGLARAHEIETGRAVLAVFLPVIVCCGGVIFLAGLVGGLGALSQSWH
jgi:hypothetical protein